MSNHTLDGAAVAEVAKLAQEAAGNQAPVEIAGVPYVSSDNRLHRVALDVPTPAPLQLTTLTALVAFLAEKDTGRGDSPPRQFLHVVNPTEVRLISELVGNELQRHVYAIANPVLPVPITAGPLNSEEFVLTLQSRCVETEDRNALIVLARGVRSDSEVGISDDGMSQTVSAKSGITFIGQQVIRNPYTLAPFRTFPEIEQPSSKFVVRAKKSERGDDPFAWTFTEADGGAWRTVAMMRVREWLEAQAPGTPVLA